MSKIAPDLLALQRLYHWEKTAPNRVALTQPMGGGVVQDFTWAQVADQVRRMATHLQAQGWRVIATCRKPQDIAAYDPKAAFDRLGLAGALSSQRSNGLAAMAARIRWTSTSRPIWPRPSPRSSSSTWSSPAWTATTCATAVPATSSNASGKRASNRR